MSHDHNPEAEESLSKPHERRSPPNPREDLSMHGRKGEEAEKAPSRAEQEFEAAEE